MPSLPGASRPCRAPSGTLSCPISESFRQRCGRMVVSTAAATKCLVAQETADWGEGGCARQLVRNNAWNTNVISPKLGRAARNWNCFLGNKTLCTCPSSDQGALSAKADKDRQVCAQMSLFQRGQHWPSNPESQPPPYTDTPYPSLLIFFSASIMPNASLSHLICCQFPH